jgi:hypothetical protein
VSTIITINTAEKADKEKYRSHLVTSLSIHVYDISIYFYYLLRLPIISVSQLDVSVGCGRGELAVHVITDNQLVMDTCLSIYHAFSAPDLMDYGDTKIAHNNKRDMRKVT